MRIGTWNMVAAAVTVRNQETGATNTYTWKIVKEKSAAGAVDELRE